MSGDEVPRPENRQHNRRRISRYLAPGRFCCGCSLEYGVLIIGSVFLVFGVIGGIIMIRYFAYFDYYSPKQTSAQDVEDRKIKDGLAIAFGVTSVYIFGIVTDVMLIVGVLKILAPLVGLWAVAIFLRGVGELILAVMMPVRCFAGGLFCQGMEILAVWWAVQIGLNFYSSYLAFSLTYYIVREHGEDERGMRGRDPRVLTTRQPREVSPPYQRPANPP